MTDHEHAAHRHATSVAMSKLTELEKAALEALAFYANPNNYDFNAEGELGPNVILDGGRRAQIVLEDFAERAAAVGR